MICAASLTPKALISYTLWFRGRRILDAIMETLQQPQYGLAKATDVLLTGCSAGGLAAYSGLPPR